MVTWERFCQSYSLVWFIFCYVNSCYSHMAVQNDAVFRGSLCMRQYACLSFTPWLQAAPLWLLNKLM